jgi:hypothetical protein
LCPDYPQTRTAIRLSSFVLSFITLKELKDGFMPSDNSMLEGGPMDDNWESASEGTGDQGSKFCSSER